MAQLLQVDISCCRPIGRFKNMSLYQICYFFHCPVMIWLLVWIGWPGLALCVWIGRRNGWLFLTRVQAVLYGQSQTIPNDTVVELWSLDSKIQ
jgi:hypothetical protein